MKPVNKNPIFPLRLAPEHRQMLEKMSSETGISQTDIARLAITDLYKSTRKKTATGRK